MPQSAPISIETVVARWRDPATRPAFIEGALVEFGPNGIQSSVEECAFCAQGDILARDGGWSLRRLADASTHEADREVARLLGISVAHAVLLRVINDSQEGCPEDVLAAPEKVLGDQAQRVLAFWRRLDALTRAEWQAIADNAGDLEFNEGALDDAAAEAAGNAANAHVCTATDPVEPSSICAATNAVREILAARLLRERGIPFTFLPLFGIADPDELES